MEQAILRKLTEILRRAGDRGASRRELNALVRLRPKNRGRLESAIRSLERQGQIVDTGDRLYLSQHCPGRDAVVTRLNRTYGFARFTDTPDSSPAQEVFIPGRYFLGALPGDTVRIIPLPQRGDKPEGKIVRILQEGDSTFTATLLRENGEWLLRPDRMMRYDFPVSAREADKAREGDKVLCRVTHRGTSHAEHQFCILQSYGDAQTAVHCAQAILDLNGISVSFSPEAEAEAERLCRFGITESDLKNRLDLRDACIFTIDSADSKDLDDAVSLEKTSSGYELSVHIADVSHYVRAGSALDEAAFHRGTSIYFADRVVPMLPRALSNGICSLNPGEDRLAFSCRMQFDRQGNLLHSEFHKSVIRSRVKGVYREINALLDGTASPEIGQKYAPMADMLADMKELAGILSGNRMRRGAPEIDTTECRILLDAHSHAVGVEPRARGISETMIEEFMLAANESAARFARTRGLPFVYRVHEPPAPDRLEQLRTVLEALGLPCAAIREGVPAGVLADLLRQTRGTPVYSIVNQNVLRSMAKAKYLERPIGHYGLVLEDYAHFTSPIRRYPDLSIHRILTDALNGRSVSVLMSRYAAFAAESARQSSATELTAMQLERECDGCYLAEYMRDHRGETFDGILSSLAPQGIYVELPNGIEGLVPVSNLPEGDYDFSGPIECVNHATGQRWRIGDRVRVLCVQADVPSGNIDFQFVSEPAPAPGDPAGRSASEASDPDHRRAVRPAVQEHLS